LCMVYEESIEDMKEMVSLCPYIQYCHDNNHSKMP
jgi:hypothetical protein